MRSDLSLNLNSPQKYDIELPHNRSVNHIVSPGLLRKKEDYAEDAFEAFWALIRYRFVD